MKYKCLIVDDEKLGRELIKNYINHFSFLEVTAECSSAIEAIPLLNTQEFDILFLDINMPQLSGMDLLRQQKKLPLTVLCTAYSEYALDSYEFDVVDYLLKPIEISRFSKAVGKIMSKLNIKPTVTTPIPSEKTNSYFFVKSEYKDIKINIDEIKFIEAMEKYIRIHLEDKKILTLMSMSKVMEHLPKNQFLRIHRSFIVNTGKIETIEGNMISINNTKIPISKANRKFLQDFKNNL